MANDKIIHTRVSDTFYEAIAKKALQSDMTVSGYSRVIFDKYVEEADRISDPFESDEFNSLIQWIYNVKFYPLSAPIYDIRHYLGVIEKYYPYLDFTVQKLFDPIVKNLNQLIAQEKEDEKEYPDFEFVDLFLFGREKNSFSFDYDSFEKYLRTKFE